jgi:glutathione S-transferase
MILVGQYDSPFVRRVAVSLRVLGYAYEHDTRSVFADFAAMRRVNQLGRIPSLVLDDGETLIDSAAILDWLDQSVGPGRALVPAAGPERRRALRRIALATGAVDKVGAAIYERLIRPSA